MSVARGFELDAARDFGRVAPLVVEIGSGTGDAVVQGALSRPGTNFLAVEVYGPGLAATVAKIVHHNLTNVRLVHADAVQVLEHMLRPLSVAELWIFFADPWHKVRHHKRRLVNPAFAELAASRLAHGGNAAAGDRLGGLRHADARRPLRMCFADQPVCRLRPAVRGSGHDPVRTEGACVGPSPSTTSSSGGISAREPSERRPLRARWQELAGHEIPTRAPDPVGGRGMPWVARDPVGCRSYCVSAWRGTWQTASTLLPSGSRTNAP